MKALIVDDDRTLSDLLAFTLRRAGFAPLTAFDAESALNLFNQIKPDVIILDVNIPGLIRIKDGFDVCRTIRQNSDVPIILLTVRDDEEDILQGLDYGADDYVIKPFSPKQLIARIQSVLRRSSGYRAWDQAPYEHNDILFDPVMRTFTRLGEETIHLTRLEARLMAYLMLNSGQIIPSNSLIDHVWGERGGNDEMLRQLVRRLRIKIEINPGEPELIYNQAGIGYGFSFNDT